MRCSRIRGLRSQFGNGLLEILSRAERPVDTGESQIRNLVEVAQRLENHQPDLVGRDLRDAGSPNRVLDRLGELRQRVLVNGPALAGASDTVDDFGATERLGHTT